MADYSPTSYAPVEGFDFRGLSSQMTFEKHPDTQELQGTLDSLYDIHVLGP